MNTYLRVLRRLDQSWILETAPALRRESWSERLRRFPAATHRVRDAARVPGPPAAGLGVFLWVQKSQMEFLNTDQPIKFSP